ncbi:MAG: DUF177 domain-containing protein [Corallococcus sp.]|nr:DUF177 domain-containing protein [Corallococcus sp.]MCM1359461.1 DUF177 domain-containing protein [Corallococcus sp.]MCM1394727.1 DUF177 domain-containing protein [Corallococcus sp.]
MNASEKIVIDITKSLANVGVPQHFCGDFKPNGNLLSYPNATLTKLSVDFDLTFGKPNVEVRGNVVCVISGKCDRCLDTVCKQIVLPFDQTFFKDGAGPDEYVYSGSKLDATKAVEDEVVLSLPTLLLCSEDCKGLCPKCGTNLNKSECGCNLAKENVFSQLKNLKF